MGKCLKCCSFYNFLLFNMLTPRIIRLSSWCVLYLEILCLKSRLFYVVFIVLSSFGIYESLKSFVYKHFEIDDYLHSFITFQVNVPRYCLSISISFIRECWNHHTIIKKVKLHSLFFWRMGQKKNDNRQRIVANKLSFNLNK